MWVNMVFFPWLFMCSTVLALIYVLPQVQILEPHASRCSIIHFLCMEEMKIFLESYADHKTYESYRNHQKRYKIPTVRPAYHVRRLAVKCSIIAKFCHSKDAYMLLTVDLKFLVHDYLINPLKQRVLKFATSFCIIKEGICMSV